MADRTLKAGAAPLPTLSEGRRIAIVDAARGVAILAMISYHAAWDIGQFGLADIDAVGNPVWRAYARTIATSFLVLVGVSLVLATRDGFDPPRFMKRLLIIIAAALLVSLGTWLMDPSTFVYFGILHLIAVASVIGLAFTRLPPAATIVAAVLAFIAPAQIASSAFNFPFLWWTGLSTDWPPSVDFIPLLPWFAATLAGIAAARFAIERGIDRQLAGWSASDPIGRSLVFVGRWSLVIYLIHQPILIGLFLAWLRLS